MKRFLKMLLAQWPLWAIVFGPTLVVAVVFLGRVAISLPDRGKEECYFEVTSLVRSPEQNQEPVRFALGRKERCFVEGLFTSHFFAHDFYVVSEGKSPGNETRILAIPLDADTPVLHWLSPRKLQITVSNTTEIYMQKASYEGIDVEVKFDPDDPPARAEALRLRELRAKCGCDPNDPVALKQWLQFQDRKDK